MLCICALFALTSCKKESETLISDNSGKDITQKLIEFKSHLNSKDGSTLSIDSAKWFLEGLLNFENANNDHDMGEINLYYDSITISSIANRVSNSELLISYQTLVKKLQKISAEENNLILFNMISLVIKPSDVADESQILMTVSAGKESKSWIIVPFVAGDDWIFGYHGGSCTTDHNNPNYWNRTSDAAEEMQYKINNSIRPRKVGYFVNIASVIVQEGQYDYNYPGRYEKNTMFMAKGHGAYAPVSDPCINSVELNYYMSKFEQVAGTAIPQGKSFLNVDIYGCFIGWAGIDPYWVRAHMYNIFYGDVVISSPPSQN